MTQWRHSHGRQVTTAATAASATVSYRLAVALYQLTTQRLLHLSGFHRLWPAGHHIFQQIPSSTATRHIGSWHKAVDVWRAHSLTEHI